EPEVQAAGQGAHQTPAHPVPQARRQGRAGEGHTGAASPRGVSGPQVRRARGAGGRPRAGGIGGAHQGGGPLRRGPEDRVLDLRDAEHPRRDQALLPRQGMGDAGAARPAGAKAVGQGGHPRPDRQERPLAHDPGALCGPRGRRGERGRGAHPRAGLQHREPRRPGEPRRAGGRHHHGPPGRRRLAHRGARGQDTPAAGRGRLAGAAAADPQSPVQRGQDADGDSRPHRREPDARLAPPQAGPAGPAGRAHGDGERTPPHDDDHDLGRGPCRAV
ncbi:MAG: RNA polymerase sigma factor SigB, partial [uncultured Rubrobacteraceae bacterium]